MDLMYQLESMLDTSKNPKGFSVSLTFIIGLLLHFLFMHCGEEERQRVKILASDFGLQDISLTLLTL